jgi:UDP-2,3-diacylglucosamine hydrolase
MGLYRSLLPADLALALAQWVSRTLHDPQTDPAVIDALRTHAREVLRRDDTDVAIMGHSHEAALHAWADGIYVNTGNWYEHRTFGRLHENRVFLSQWNGTRVLDIESATV